MVNAVLPWKKASEEEHICNYRHSRARRCIENALGILSAYWRILHKSIRATIENVEKYTLACLALHNYLRLPDNAHYTLSGFADLEDKDGNLLPGEWRLLKRNDFNKWVENIPKQCWGKFITAKRIHLTYITLCFVTSTLFLIVFNNKEKTQ